jgi:hypothetical protein
MTGREDRLTSPGRAPFAIALSLSIALLPVALGWAGRVLTRREGAQDALARLSGRQTLKFPRPAAIERPGGLSPFGPGFRIEPPVAGRGRGLVETAIGYVDPGRPEMLRDVPEALRTPAPALLHRGARGGLQEGVNILTVDEAALGRLGFDRIAADVGRLARLLAAVPDRGLVVRASRESLGELAALPFVRTVGPYHPAYKVSPLTGRIPLMQASRARSRTLDLEVTLWSDADPAAARRRLAGSVGE